MTTVLVTGHKGFIGGRLFEYLQSLKKYELEGVDLIDGNNVVDWIPDEPVDIVVHCAALTSVTQSMDFPIEDAHTNILGTINMLMAYPDSKFIYLSSAGVYGEGSKHTEASPVKPMSPYAISKYTGEQYVRVLAKEWVILRLANVVDFEGEFTKGEPNVYQIFNQSKDLTIYGDGMQTRDFIDVRDVAKAIERSFNHQGLFNIGSGKQKTVLDVAKEFKKPYQFKPGRPGEIREFGLDISKAQKTGIL